MLEARLLISTLFHFQTDSQTECANRDIVQIFWIVVHPDQRNWINKVDLMEFTINASISVTMSYAPFELNGGHIPSMIKEIHSDKIIPKGIKDFANQALQNLADTNNAIIEICVSSEECQCKAF